MSRTILITGASSGIGKASARRTSDDATFIGGMRAQFGLGGLGT